MSSTRIPLTDFSLAEAPTGSTPDSFDVGAAEWLPAVVPGGVHESLLAAGRIEHPYRDRNEGDARWIEQRDWWFRTSFGADAAADGERVRLVFDGLDTVVSVWLNGELLGEHENMFRPAEFDVTDRILETNELLLRFRPPLEGLEQPAAAREMFARLGDVFAELTGDRSAPDGDGAAAGGDHAAAAEAATEPEEEGGLMSPDLPLATLRRKATFSWGWDFGPRVPSVGIWRPAALVRERDAVITGHHVRTDAIGADRADARVHLLVEVDTFGAGNAGGASGALTASVTLTSPSGREFRTELAVRDGRAEGELIVERPELWWTHDLGTPALHDVTIELRDGERVLDTRTDRVGLRRIELDRGADPEGGRRFRFVLNGVPIFARGAAWLPADMLVGSVAPERQRELVRTAAEGDMNMLRIWGGGVYEHDAFYAATDELGVLVWHDFMFACIDYPSADATLQREVALEAEYQVRRLRNRASMALWSGNNEVQLIHGFAYQSYDEGDWGWHFFDRILPEAVQRFDGGVPYWPGSPWGEDEAEGFMAVNGVRDGDRHAWEVWHGFDFGAGGGPYDSVGEARHYRRYANDRGKFISEFGIHASPELGTLQHWIPDAALTVHSPSFDAHNKDNPKDKGDALLEIITGLPDSIEQYVDFTMVSQAEGLKFGVEHYRRRAPHCSGTLIWQFNDVWPGFSWSVVDYENVPKAGYWFAKRAFSPVSASFAVQDDRLALWVTNGTADALDTVAEVELASFAGDADAPVRVTVRVPAGEAAEVWSVPLEQAHLGTDRYARVSSPEGLFPANRLFGAEVKDVAFGPSELTAEVLASDPAAGTARLRLSSRGYTYFAHLVTPAPGVRFSDNYIDLRDAESVEIEVTGLPDGFDPAVLEARRYAGALTP